MGVVGGGERRLIYWRANINAGRLLVELRGYVRRYIRFRNYYSFLTLLAADTEGFFLSLFSLVLSPVGIL